MIRSILLFLVSTLFFASGLFGQLEVLRDFNLNPDLLSQPQFVVINDSDNQLLAESQLIDSDFDRAVLAHKGDYLILTLVNSRPSIENLTQTCEALIKQYGKDEAKKGQYSTEELELFAHGAAPHRSWKKKDTGMSILLSYAKRPSNKDDYPGINLIFYIKNKDDGFIDLEAVRKLNSAVVRSNDTSHFRNAKWGDSKESVISIEGAPNTSFDNTIVYTGQRIANKFKVIVSYTFVDDSLVRAKYLLDEEHTNLNDYVSDHLAIESILKEKYGPPVKEDFIWNNDLFKGDHKNYGKAIAVGHMKIISIWRTIDTEITLLTSGSNFKVNLQVDYQSRKLIVKEKQLDRQAGLRDF